MQHANHIVLGRTDTADSVSDCGGPAGMPGRVPEGDDRVGGGGLNLAIGGVLFRSQADGY